MAGKKKTFIVILLLFTLLLSGFLQFRIVATMDGIHLLYQNEVYEESYEVFDYERGRRLGNVDFEDFRCGLYELKGHPEYLYVSMGFGPDHRIYKITE